MDSPVTNTKQVILDSSTTTMQVPTLASQTAIMNNNVHASTSPKLDGGVEGEIVSPNARTLQTDHISNMRDSNVHDSRPHHMLLQNAQTADNSPVLIPGSLLVSLLTSINTLREEVCSTRHELAVVKSDMKNVQEASGMAFRLFPKLPLELRRMVWRFALFTPRIVDLRYNFDYARSFDEHYFPYTILFPLRGVYHEARVEALKVHTPLFVDKSASRRPNNPIFHSKNIFINDSVDTVFMTREPPSDFGLLVEIWAFRLLADHALRISRLSLRRKRWDAIASGDITWPIDTISRFGTEEICLVIGKIKTCHSPDVMFVKPRKSPEALLSKGVVTKKKKEMGYAENQPLTWDAMEDYWQSRIQKAKSKQTRIRQARINKGLDPNINLSGYYVKETSMWTVKKITYVEATTPARLVARRKASKV